MSFLEQLVVHRRVSTHSDNADSRTLQFVKSFLESARLGRASSGHISGIEVHNHQFATDIVGRLPFVSLIVNGRKLRSLIACGQANHWRILGITDNCLRK